MDSETSPVSVSATREPSALLAMEGRAARAGFALDEAQRRPAERLAAHADRLNRGEEPPEGARRGIYLWGPVGRGKSWLMDTFAESVPGEGTWRVHYHDLFRQYHRLVYERHAGTGRGAIVQALDDMLSSRQLICIDEFSVNDIGDGMLSHRLFTELFARGLTVVLTSNYHPDQLLPHPVYHELYRPGIAQLLEELEVIEVDGGLDHRTESAPAGAAGAAAPLAARTAAPAPAGNDPHALTSAARFREGRFVQAASRAQQRAGGLDVPAPADATTVAIGHYRLAVRRARGDEVWVGFSELCEEYRSTLDYLNLTDTHRTIVIEGVPVLDDQPMDVRRRWIDLVDVLYDRGCLVTLISPHSSEDVLRGNAQHRDFARTASRLRLLAVG